MNCSPKEFIAQAVKFRKPFADWVEKAGFAEIQKRKPEGLEMMTGEEKAKAIKEQNLVNMGDMIEAALEKDPEGTLTVLALCCFTEPDEMKGSIKDYLNAFFEMLTDETMRSFFQCYAKPKTRSSSAD